MIYDDRLNSIAKLAVKHEKSDDRRTQLDFVYFEKTAEGKYIAVATDGHMLLKAEFPEIKQEDYPAYDSIIPDAELSDTFLVKGELIISAFKACPKNPRIPILKCISIRADKTKAEIYSTNLESKFSNTCNYAGFDYPNWKPLIPQFAAPQECMIVSGAYLKIIGDMATNMNKTVKFIFHGDKTNESSFEIKCKDDLTITGLIMPLRDYD